MSCEAEARKRVIYRVTFVGFVVNLVPVSYTHLRAHET